MIKLKLLRKHGQWKMGDVIEVSKNDAHTLIDKGIAKVFVGYENKMMTTRDRRSKRKTKRNYFGK